MIFNKHVLSGENIVGINEGISCSVDLRWHYSITVRSCMVVHVCNASIIERQGGKKFIRPYLKKS